MSTLAIPAQSVRICDGCNCELAHPTDITAGLITIHVHGGSICPRREDHIELCAGCLQAVEELIRRRPKKMIRHPVTAWPTP